MDLSKLKKEDKIIIAVSIVIDVIMAISSMSATVEGTEQQITLPQWLAINLFIIFITFVIDVAIIKKREQKRKDAEQSKERAEKEMSIMINIKSGGIGHNGLCEMHQLFENDLFYFGNDSANLYEMVGYEWDGAKYQKVTATKTEGTEEGKKKATGFASGGLGMVGGLGSTKSVSKQKSSGEVVEKDVEEQGTAIVRMRRIRDDRISSFIMECDSEMDKKIRCFNKVPV